MSSRPPLGRVMITGAGPGSPDLITVRGLREIRRAEVLVYDRLVHPELLEEAQSRAERIFVGKKGGHYRVPQNTINRILVDRARAGRYVVRLKGGDPFLFGRGGEEALHLLRHDIPFEIIPGVSSCIAAPAAAGIPVTHRGLSSSLTILSGHQVHDPRNPLNWRALVEGSQTLVILMATRTLNEIVEHLLAGGVPEETPAALIQSATLPDQNQIRTSLSQLVSQSRQAGIASPATLIVGEVVRLGLQPFEEILVPFGEMERELRHPTPQA